MRTSRRRPQGLFSVVSGSARIGGVSRVRAPSGSRRRARSAGGGAGRIALELGAELGDEVVDGPRASWPGPTPPRGLPRGEDAPRTRNSAARTLNSVGVSSTLAPPCAPRGCSGRPRPPEPPALLRLGSRAAGARTRAISSPRRTLGDVVVGAEVEAHDLVHLGRCARSAAAPASRRARRAAHTAARSRSFGSMTSTR